MCLYENDSLGKFCLNFLDCNSHKKGTFYLRTQDLLTCNHTYVWKDTHLYLFYIHTHAHTLTTKKENMIKTYFGILYSILLWVN